jgi:hypothetical protein
LRIVGAMQMDAPFARLPLQLDAERLGAEVQQFEWFEWVPFRFMPSGYGSIELISSFGRSMDPAVAPFLPTANLDRCPYIRQVLASFPGVYYAAHLRWLGPGARVDRHWDGRFYCINRPRVHIPIVTSDRALFAVGDKRIHMGAGEVWVFDRFAYHVADNEGDSDRIHLTMDLTPDLKFFELVAGAHKPFKYSSTGGGGATPAFIPYSSEPHAQLRTEQFATGPGNSPAEVDMMTRELVGWMRRNPIQDEIRAQAVERELERFRIAWRCRWAQFGCTREGWPSYLALGRETLAALREIEREGEHTLVRDDVPVWKRLRDYLFLGLLSSRGVRSIVPDAVVPDIDERFVVPDVLFRFASVTEVEVFAPRRGEFMRIDHWLLSLLAHIASHERLPEDAYDGPDGDAARAAIRQLLDWELLLPQASMPRPAWTVELSELGVSEDLSDARPVAPGSTGSREQETAAALVDATTRLRLSGPAPHYARLRWRGYEVGTELLFLRPGAHTTLDVEALHSLLHFTEEISLSALSERLEGVLDDENLAAVRTLVRLGVLEPRDAAPTHRACSQG